MATTLKATKAVAYYSGEVNTSISLAGYLTGNRVMQYTFTSPATGATEFSVSITGVSMYSSSYPSLRFYLTDSPTSHINAGTNTTEYDGELIRAAAGAGEKGQHKYTSNVVQKLLLPNTTYYLYIFTANTYARSAYFPYDGLQYTTDLATITVEGGAGLVYIDTVPHQAYIDNGTSWDLYMPNADNGTSWDLLS